MRKVRIILPTLRENREINRGIKADPDTYELSDAEIRSMRPLGRPRSQTPKIPVTVRLDKTVVDYFKASGRGWQTRLNATLADYVGRRPR